MSIMQKAGRPAVMKTVSVAVLSALFIGCSSGPVNVAESKVQPVEQVAKMSVAEASNQANELFDEIFMSGVMRSPTYQTYLGIKKDQDKWGEISEADREKELAFSKADLAKLNALDASNLDEQTQLSLSMFKEQLQNNIDDYKWRLHGYPVNQMYGTHTQVPSLLINQHRIADVKDAKDYIGRLVGIEKLMTQLSSDLGMRADKGIIAPKFVFPYVISASKNIIKGAPFEEGPDSTLLADFSKKVGKLEVTEQVRSELIESAKSALINHVGPGYSKLMQTAASLEKMATTDDGAWKFPDGDAFYNNALKRTTSTDLTAAEIHQIGLDEVTRIHDEMREIMKQVDFKGDLKAFFQFMKTDKRFYFPEGEQGRATYLKEATALIDTMKGQLDSMFNIKPQADLDVKAVEPFREKSAGKAFYERPSMDGSRPGRYYVNLYSMSDMPSYQMEALAYHEGLPGHHMQIAIANELTGIPKFRKLGGYTAYVEGWGLYAELLPKEAGFYQDPYADFGRLAMELWRACRLVVDTGLHNKRWTRQQAIDYLAENTPNPKGDVVKAIDRYIVMPSQATAYKIGMLKILELREKAKAQMKDRFDIRKFHGVVLKNGPVPLNVLEQFVDKYIQQG